MSCEIIAISLDTMQFLGFFFGLFWDIGDFLAVFGILSVFLNIITMLVTFWIFVGFFEFWKFLKGKITSQTFNGIKILRISSEII